MQRKARLWTGVALFFFVAAGGWAQEDRLQGRWEGSIQTPQGEQAIKASFKKEGAAYTGRITGMRGETAFKEIKLDGDKLTAKAEIETPQGSIGVDYDFTFQGETLKGKAEAEFGGQRFSYNLELKRTSTIPAEPQAATQQSQGQERPRRESAPQPIQQQRLEYFQGQWKFKWQGKESALGPGGPKEGVLTYTPVLEGKFLEGRTEGKSDAGNYQELTYLGWDAEKKILTSFEYRAAGIPILAVGDWTSPIAIRFNIPPLQVNKQTIRLKRTISVVAAHSYTVLEEISLEGGPFERLGNGIFTKVEANASR